MRSHRLHRRSAVAAALLGFLFQGCGEDPGKPSTAQSAPGPSIQSPRIGIVAASEGVLYSGPSTLAGDAPPPDFDRALPFTDTFVRARVLSIGRAHLNTDSGDLVNAPQPVGFFPFTPVTFEIEEIVVQRPRSAVKTDVTVGETMAINLPGGSVTAAMTGAMAATMFLVNDKALDAQNPEKEAPVAATDLVEITIAFDAGVSLAVDDEVVLGLRKTAVEWVTGEGRSTGRELLSIADGASSVVVLKGDSVFAAAHTAPRGIPTTTRELRERVSSLATSGDPAK